MTNPQALEALRFAKQCLMSERATGQPVLPLYLNEALEKINSALAAQQQAEPVSEQAISHAIDMARGESHKQGDAAFHRAFARALWRQWTAQHPAPQPEAQALPDSPTLRIAAQTVVAVRKRHGWSPEADAAIHALEAALSSQAPAPLTDEAVAARNPYIHSANHKSVWAAGFRDAERSRGIGLDGGM